MSWSSVLTQTYEVDEATERITLPTLFSPYFRLIIGTELIAGLGKHEPSIGLLSQHLITPLFGDVKGQEFSLAPGLQLITPATEFPYHLVLQPLKRRFSFTLFVQVETTVSVATGGTTDNAPVLAAIAALQAQIEALPANQGTDYSSAIAAIQTNINGLSVGVADSKAHLLALGTEQGAITSQLTALQQSQQVNQMQTVARLEAILALLNNAAPEPGPTALTFASVGDPNGVFYWLGTFYGQHVWINPQVLQVCTAIISSLEGGQLMVLTNRTAAVQFYSTDAPGQWVAFDLGQGNTLTLNHYAIQHDSETGYYLRNWKLQGSNAVSANTVTGMASANWTDLKVHTGDAMINTPNDWGSWAVSGVTTGYRWFRILMTGANASGDNYLVLGEVEFYGSLVGTS